MLALDAAATDYQRNYRSLMQYLIALLQDKNRALVEASERQVELEAKVDDPWKAERAKVDEIRKQFERDREAFRVPGTSGDGGLLSETPRSSNTPVKADGHIVSVNTRLKQVSIDLVRPDGLDPEVKFVVFKKGTTDFKGPSSKGIVEVTRVLGGHLAEARIINSSEADPIQAGDLIYSPTWP
jgi:hypothetical protein